MTIWLTIGTWEGWNTVTHKGILEIPKREKLRFEKIKKDDKVLFYTKVEFRPEGMLPSAIVGSAIVKQIIPGIPPEEITLSRAKEMLEPYRCQMKNIYEFSTPVALQPLIEELEFIRNKRRWTIHLTHALQEISEKDYALITSMQTRHRIAKNP